MNENEVLSEEEVDALMDGVASGEVGGESPLPAGEVIPYDLTDQDHIVRGQLPVLEKINANFIRLLEEGFEQMLQRPVEIQEEGLQTVRTSDYIHSLGLPVSLNFVELPPMQGEALVALDPAMVFAIVDIYFGGTGKYRNQMIGRDFTPTENRIIQLVLNQLLQDLGAAWEPVMQISPRYIKSESDPQYSVLAGSREMLVISSFRIELDDCGGEFHIALPGSMIEPVRDVLDGGLRKNRSSDQSGWLQVLQQNIQEAEVELRATIARTRLTLRDVVGLQSGDVIPVNQPEQATLQVSDVPVYAGRFGVYRQNNAVRVTGVVDDAEKARLKQQQE
ncbi:MAG: flagellar motor switch protein FliM [Gammaproteobacteria bacterium]